MKLLKKLGRIMKYLIDSAQKVEINKALVLGFQGITANPTLCKKEELTIVEYVKEYQQKTDFLTAEVMGTLSEMKTQVDALMQINSNLIIKLNYGEIELEFTKYLKEKNIKFAFTLIFTPLQATLAIQAGASYIFVFIARNEELGNNPVEVLKIIKEIITINNYKCEIIGASIRNENQLNIAAKYCQYAAIPLTLIEKSFKNEQTIKGRDKFNNDFDFKNNQ